MNIWRTKKIIDRLERMIENAVMGKDIETLFDESKVSALESKLNRYLVMLKTKGSQVEEEKLKIKELISDISHQTKTPIANLMLYSGLLLEKEGLSGEHEKMISEINHQSKKLDFLISALIKTSRLEAGIISVKPCENQVDQMLEEVVNQNKPKADERNIEIIFKATNSKAIFDYKWTCEAIDNIVDNAVKYSEPGGRIEVSVIMYEMFCRIDIMDNGIGISDDEINKVFSRFYRSQAVGMTPGVGIGLYLAREIIENQGGYIKLKSQLLRGSTFSVYLPL